MIILLNIFIECLLCAGSTYEKMKYENTLIEIPGVLPSDRNFRRF